MIVKNIIKDIILASAVFVLILAINAMIRANDDFSLRLTLNGEDISQAETVTVDPEETLRMDLQIYDVTGGVILKKLSVSITFIEQAILSQSVDLGNYHVAAGESYRDEMTMDIKDALTYGGHPWTTGIYRGQLNLEYVAGSQEKTRSQWINIRILGNPLSTPAGAAGMAVGAGTLAAILLLVKSLVVPAIPKGTALPSSISLKPQTSLRELAMGRLEPTARGRVTGSIVGAAKKIIVKDKCPICETRLKHGYCYTCQKSAKEVRQEFTARMKDLALQTAPLINSGQVATLDDLCKQLSISRRLATDVIATLAHARLVKVKGLARKLMGKAVMVGIGTGLSIIIWVTIGGLAFLSTTALVIILAASVAIPLVVTKSLQIRARHDIKKSKS
jgi:hypothetical protein